MGQANSIFVWTEKANFFCGEVVRGSINLNCITPFNCHGLHMTVLGEERTHWKEQRSRSRTTSDGRTETEWYDVFFDGHNTFFKVKVMVFNFGGHVQPGQYSFPFSFQIPMGLPGVFEGSSFQQARGSISYSIHAECEVGGIFNPNIRHCQNFIINELLQQNVAPISFREHTNVNCCCCFNRGHADLSVHVSKNCYAPGELAHVICDVRNESSEAFTLVRVKLVRTMNLRAQHHTHTSVDVVSENDYSGIDANSNHAGPNALQLPLQLSPAIYPSVIGRLVQCQYHVEVTLVSKGCCISNLTVRVPVRIYAPQPPPPPAFSAPPPNWAPQQMQPLNLAIPPPAPDALPPPYGAVATQPPYQGGYAQASAPGAAEKTPLLS